MFYDNAYLIYHLFSKNCYITCTCTKSISCHQLFKFGNTAIHCPVFVKGLMSCKTSHRRHFFRVVSNVSYWIRIADHFYPSNSFWFLLIEEICLDYLQIDLFAPFVLVLQPFPQECRL